MILAHILGMNNEQALEIVEVLTDKKMLLHAMLFKKPSFKNIQAPESSKALKK
ncbi:MAG: hypothetical protein WBN18_07035 [Flavobacteriaceae bacterium]